MLQRPVHLQRGQSSDLALAPRENPTESIVSHGRSAARGRPDTVLKYCICLFMASLLEFAVPVNFDSVCYLPSFHCARKCVGYSKGVYPLVYGCVYN